MRRSTIPLVLVLCLLGCASPPEETSPFALKLHPDSVASDQATARFVALDRGAVGDLYYVDSRQERLPSGQVRILVNLRSAKDRDAWVDWKAVFYDDRDFRLEETEWHADLFPGGEVKTITTESIRRDVKKFTVMFRSAPGRIAEEG